MGEHAQTGVARFFATHQAAIVALTAAIQDEVGGHYAAMDPSARAEAAESNALNFATAVVSGHVPHDGIAQLLATHPDPSVVAEIVRMVNIQEQRFAEFVAAQLPADPLLAAEIQRRARTLATRFRMALASASVTELVQRMEKTPRPGPPAPPRAR